MGKSWFKPWQGTAGGYLLHIGSIMPIKTQIKKIRLFSKAQIGYGGLVISPSEEYAFSSDLLGRVEL